MNGKKNLNHFYRKSAEDFKIIPGEPISYWLSEIENNIFANNKMNNIATTRVGLQTGDNARFVRLWFECDKSKISFDCKDRKTVLENKIKWVPYNKGGKYRKWYGNVEHIVNWENDGYEIFDYARKLYGSPTRTVKNSNYYFKASITWSKISSGKPSFRYQPRGSIFDVAGASVFFSKENIGVILLGLLNCIVIERILKAISPTLNYETTHIGALPLPETVIGLYQEHGENIDKLIDYSKNDWFSYETTWNFKIIPLLMKDYSNISLSERYKALKKSRHDEVLEMQHLEEKNNRIFIDAYGLQDELSPEVSLEDITLSCNPYYRYGGDKSEKELEDLLRADTMRELVSYAVGCIFGRYSLDKENLILANAGDGIDEYLQQVPNPTFHPDESGILPLTEEDDFADDLPTQVRRFIRTAFGEEHFEQNIRFIEDALSKDLRNFLLKDLYKDHVRRYKKRPIYWMVSSPKGAFRALFYLHRYTPDTIGRLLNEYVRPFMKKLQNKIDNGQHQVNHGNLSRGEVTQLQKHIEINRAELREITEWERQVYDIAAKRIELDLDDGVKVNYQKLGTILEPIKGLNA